MFHKYKLNVSKIYSDSVCEFSTYRFVKKLCMAWTKHLHEHLPALKTQGNMVYKENHHFFNNFELRGSD